MVKSLNEKTKIQTELVDAVMINDAAFFEAPIIFMEPVSASTLKVKGGNSSSPFQNPIWAIGRSRGSHEYTEQEVQRLREYVVDRGGVIYMPTHGLFFSVLLRRSLMDQRILGDPKVINYIANMLSLFVKTDRLYRIQRHDEQTSEYLTDMITEAQNANSRRQFIVYAHIGNYSLYLTGIFPQAIQYRHRYKNRPVNMQFYINFGREYYAHASAHAMAREYQLEEVFFRLSIMFEVYQNALNHLAKQYLVLS